MKKIVYLALVISIFAVTGCASIMKGTSQVLTFTSEPEGATVIIDGKEFGKTPLDIKLKKNKYSNVMFKKEGYKSRSAIIEKQFDGIALINVFWDLSTTDLITGAIFEYSPSQYYIELKKAVDD